MQRRLVDNIVLLKPAPAAVIDIYRPEDKVRDDAKAAVAAAAARAAAAA